MTTSYIPISCTLHDELESAATLRTSSTVKYLDGESECVVHDTLSDIITDNGAEYLILSQGSKIRLDTIREFNGIPFGQDNC